MSANNLIYIDRSTNQVYYQGCADNDDLGDLVGQGTDLETAIDIAEQIEDDYGGTEYGIEFVRTNNKNKTKTKPELNYVKMLKEINKLVSTDFAMDMDGKGLPHSNPYTQEEANKMAGIIGQIFSIAHCTYCTACQHKYLKNK